jgi:hypothetical protein
MAMMRVQRVFVDVACLYREDDHGHNLLFPAIPLLFSLQSR